jgi:MFS transporter, ACS family, tartrate transporter
VLWVLNDGPASAGWLTVEDKVWLDEELKQDRLRYGATEHHSLKDAFRLPAVWLLAGVYIVIQIGVYVVNLWMPLMLDSLSAGRADASLIARYSTLPYLLAAGFTVAVGWSSDRWNERRGHLGGCMVLAAAGFCGAAAAHSLGAALIAFCVTAIGLWSAVGPFWALATRQLTGAAAAGGVAMITTIGACGGFFGPYLTGFLKDLTHSFTAGLMVIAGLAVAGAGLCLLLGPKRRLEDA